MREIKFRAWNPKLRFMDDDFFLHSMGGIYDRAERTYDTPNIEIEHVDDLIIMQYTGLHDKNGVAVYEDDIIILEPDDSKEYGNEPHSLSYGDICTVEWSNTNLAYYLMPVDENKEEQQMDYFGAWTGWNWIKVIGNQHQHPDLIRKD